VLITGVTGFIGSHLAAKLLEKGYTVYGLIRHTSQRSLQQIKTILDETVVITGDLTNFHSMTNVIRSANPDYIIHLAAMSPVQYSFERPFEYELINYLGTMNVIHALLNMTDCRNRRLLVASTAEVYGLQEKTPFKEDLPLKPSSPYAVSKAAVDMYARMTNLVYDAGFTILRPTNTYGRLFQTNFIVEYLVTEMLRQMPVNIGAPDSVRDYIHVSDHVAAYMLAMEHERASGKVYNVGSGVGVSNRELAKRLSKIIDYSGKIVYGTYPPGYPQRPIVSDQPYLVLDASRISMDLGWSPKVNLVEGLEKTVKYWKERLQS
jgi:GDP-mannose 4,6-dehydratase